MNASYELRLLFQCLNSFFIVYLLLSIVVYCVTPLSVWWAEQVRPALGVRVLLVLRLLPLTAALYAAVAIALPSYLRLEPETQSERIGFWALALTALCLACWVPPLGRTIRALWKSSLFLKKIRRAAHPSQLPCDSVWISSEREPQIAVAGLLRPKVYLSKSALELFDPDELNVVILHENAHQQSRDNLKRLLLLVLPDALPLLSFTKPLERALRRLIEWSADDCAAAGESRRAIALAHALVRFARHQTREESCILATSLLDDTSDLARRVDRLLGRSQACRRTPRIYLLSAVLATAILAAAMHFADLSHAHRWLELLSH